MTIFSRNARVLARSKRDTPPAWNGKLTGKIAAIATLLRRAKGASIVDLMQATG